jgi:SulP family sulfate permease
MESIAIAKAIQAKHMDGDAEDRYKINANQELIGLGIANIGGAFFQSFPVTGGFSRTAVNNQSGALTGMAAIFSSILIILTLLFLTPLFYYLPNAILAAVIMVAVFSLINVKEAIHLWHAYRADFWMLIATFLGTLLLGIEEGILIGVVLSLGMLIYKTTRPHMAVLGKVPGTIHYRNMSRFDDLKDRSDVLVVRFDARLYYANSNFFQDNISEYMQQKGETLKLLILDGDSINGIDSTGVHALETLYDQCSMNNIKLYFVGLKGPVRDVLYKSGFYDKYDKDIFFIRVQDAIDYFDDKNSKSFEDYALQSNADDGSQ